MIAQKQFKAATSPIRRQRVVACKCAKFSFSDVIAKRKDLDKLRIERIKEIGNTIDHIAKSEVKQTVEIMTEFLPFLTKLKDLNITKESVQEE